MKTKAVTLLSLYVLLCFTLQSPCVKAITCDISQLSPCVGPIMYGSATPSACCSSLKMQQPCLCQYARNPLYAGYVYGSNSRRVASDCHVSLPRC
ncbi:non-specific lipid-transfer protein 2 [Carex littledalei]|uniref:Non-specific lipid-transfer protein 2 n=1 Tax=Carex littledalei TaxID=544730 RepID=A0A833QXM0_9POAL|nr:non-specific lipid-transfer protein 2 [Carex littledalei]